MDRQTKNELCLQKKFLIKYSRYLEYELNRIEKEALYIEDST